MRVFGACAGLWLIVSCGGSQSKSQSEGSALDAGLDAAVARESMRPKSGAGGHSGTRANAEQAGEPAAAGRGATAGSGGRPSPQAGHASVADGGSKTNAGDGDGDMNDAGSDQPGRCRVPTRAPGSATIWLVVDGSGSMVEMLGDVSRWTALRSALLDPAQGVVKTLEHAVQWGLAVYDGPLPNFSEQPLPDGGIAMFPAGPAMTCPRVQTVAPAPDNYAAIEAAYNAQPLGGSTPTDRALQTLLDRYQSAPATGAVSIVLATDGAPNDFCSDSEAFPPADVRPRVISAVTQLFASGITTYVVSLAADDQNLMQHVTEVAAAGGTGKSPFVPADQSGLADSLRSIVGDDATCDVRLTQRVELASACDGQVSLNGKPLLCNAADGFRLHDEATLRLSGTACDAYQAANAPDALQIDYPCDLLR